MLCTVCSRSLSLLTLPNSYINISQVFPTWHYKTARSIHQAADSECTLCYTIYVRAGPCWRESRNVSSPSFTRSSIRILRIEDELVIRARVEWAISENTSKHVDTHFLSYYGNRATELAYKIESSSTGSKDCLKLIEYWLRTCDTGHTACRRPRSIQYPRRLLELSGAKSSDVSSRIIETRDRDPGPYCALSHCWGSDLSVKSYKSNIAQYMVSLPVSSLPLSFQHAIDECCRLKVKYLWIDALCILQDFGPSSEWNQESLRMDSIYGNAYFTIAASAATDSSKGLFRSRKQYTTH